MPTPLCRCGRFMRCQKNSVTVEELREDGAPSCLWEADLYGCEACGAEVITGFARVPFAEHWQPSYARVRNGRTPIYPGRWP